MVKTEVTIKIYLIIYLIIYLKVFVYVFLLSFQANDRRANVVIECGWA